MNLQPCLRRLPSLMNAPFLSLILCLGFISTASAAGKNREIAENPALLTPNQTQAELENLHFETIDEGIQYCTDLSDSSLHKENSASSAEPRLIAQNEKTFEDQRKRYCNNKLDLGKFARSFGGGLLTGPVLEGITSLFTHYCLPYLLGDNPEIRNTIVVSNTTMAMNAALRSVFLGLVYGIRECKLTVSEGLGKLHKMLKKATQEQVRQLPADFRESIAVIDSFVESVTGPYTGGYEEEVTRILRLRHLVFLTLPQTPKDLMTLDEERDRKLNHLLDQYPENRDALEIQIDHIRENSKSDQPRRVQFYLYGPPGTGKTTFAKGLADALGLYFCDIPVKDMNNAGDLVGTETVFNIRNDVNEDRLLGKIGNCYRKAGHTNLVFFFDEIGDLLAPSRESEVDSGRLVQLKATLKKLFDPETNQLSFEGIGVKMDFSRATIIGAGNAPLNDVAMLSRLQQFPFLRLDQTQKFKALKEGYTTSLQKLQQYSLDEDTRKKIKSIADQYLKALFLEDSKDFPGGRVIKEVTDELVGFLRNKITKNQNPSPAEIEKFLRQSFDRRRIHFE